jgi:hypothetical protein
MYIVAIAWLYVTLMMSITEPNLTAGLLTFLFYGVLPCALFLWLFGTPQRNRNKSAKIAEKRTGEPDRPDAEAD